MYTTITYTITFVANDATVGTATYTVEDKNYTAPTVPVLQCRLGSWESVELTFGDITVAAVYTWSHTYSVTTVAPTCTVAGLETSVCSVCDDVHEEPISALGHNWFVTEEKAALCEAEGFIHYGCQNGECQETKEDIVAALGHTWTMISEIKALCEADGSQHFDCENCEKEKTEIVKAIGHIWQLVSSSVVTCMEDGFNDYGCQNCTHTKTEETLANGHNFVSGKCSVCTLSEYGSISDYQYSSYGSGYKITGVRVQRKEMRVPASIGGKPVTKIYNSAFKNCTAEIIVIPDSVTEIASGAFNGCANLKQIVLPFIGQTNCDYSERTRYPFGTIFGGSFTGGVATLQKYKSSGYTNTTTYYIPENLKKVTVTSGYTNNYDFMNCSTIKHVVYGENTVFQSGAQPFNGMTALERVTLPENMTAYPTYFFSGLATETFVIPENITELPNYLFYNSSLKSITIPETVTEIGTNLFNGCSALESVTLPSDIKRISDYMFANCTGLTELVLPETVTEIGDGAFSGCSSIVDLVVPDRITYIGKSAFSYMQNLQSVTLPFIGSSEKTLNDAAYETFGYVFAHTGRNPANSSSYYTTTHYKFDEQGAQSTYTSYLPKTLINVTIKRGDVLPRAFIYCSYLQNVALPETAGYGFSAFYNCSALKSVDIGVGATALDNQIFYNCAALETVTGGENVLSIGESVFYNCKKLTAVPAFEKVTAIGAFAFYECASLQEVNIPDGVTAIGIETFYNCSSLTKADIPESVEKIGNYAFYNTRIETLSIPEKVTEIPYSLVNGNTALKTVTMGDNVAMIRSNAFEGCTALQTVYLSAALTYIDYSVFKNCRSLQSIEIPNGVTKLYGSTFENCSALETVVLPENITLIASTAFQGCTSIEATKTENGAAYLGSQSKPYALLLRPVETATNVTVNKATLTVNRDAFKNSEVTDIVLEEGFTTIHEYAFANATNLKTVSIPNTVTLVCAYAFQNCSQITELTLPDSVEQIVKGALGDMLGLTKLTIPFVGEMRKTETETYQ